MKTRAHANFTQCLAAGCIAPNEFNIIEKRTKMYDVASENFHES